MLKINKIWLFCLIGLIVTACSISYKFNGASIDYTKDKTITIKDFPNQAPLVYPPLSQKFTEALKEFISVRPVCSWWGATATWTWRVKLRAMT